MIKNLADFHELSILAEHAADALETLSFGSHAQLKRLLREKYGIVALTREIDINKARQLCDEYITANGA